MERSNHLKRSKEKALLSWKPKEITLSFKLEMSKHPRLKHHPGLRDLPKFNTREEAKKWVRSFN